MKIQITKLTNCCLAIGFKMHWKYFKFYSDYLFLCKYSLFLSMPCPSRFTGCIDKQIGPKTINCKSPIQVNYCFSLISLQSIVWKNQVKTVWKLLYNSKSCKNLFSSWEFAVGHWTKFEKWRVIVSKDSYILQKTSRVKGKNKI